MQIECEVTWRRSAKAKWPRIRWQRKRIDLRNVIYIMPLRCRKWRLAVKLVITEITEMHHNTYCIAGWRSAEKRMVRPVICGQPWSSRHLQRYELAPGTALGVRPINRTAYGVYPHSTEDVIVDPASLKILDEDPVSWFGATAPPVAAHLEEAFEGCLQSNSVKGICRYGAYVPVGSKCRSLWAVTCERKHLSFVEDIYHEEHKLYAMLQDGANLYKLRVSCKSLKEAWRLGGLRAIQATLPAQGRLHVRVGLARVFDGQPKKCFVMLNGVLW